MTLAEEIQAIRNKLETRDWLANELKQKEEHFGLDTADFLAKWRAGEIPEPDDPDLLSEFQAWEGLARSLERVEAELKDIEDRLGTSNRSHRNAVPA